MIFAVKGWAEQRGVDFGDFRQQWAFQKELFGLLCGWQKLALAFLAVYTAVNFSVGFAAVMSSPDAGFSFRMFSGHWLFFYFVSAVFAHRLLGLRHAPVSPL